MKSAEELNLLLASCPQAGTVWQHYKGGRYRIICSAILEESLTLMVVYKKMGPGNTIFVRPAAEWSQAVYNQHHVKLPRFTLVSRPEAGPAEGEQS